MSHIKLHLIVDGKLVTKPFTPISPVNHKGSVVFVIKIYRDHPDFPNGGKFTKALEKLEAGDSINCEGPIGYFKYLGWG